MSRLNKELGIAQGAGLMSTSLLGAGVFVVPALAASIAGRWSLLAWLILILLVLPVAFTFAMLGRQHPHAGGASHIVGQALGIRFEKLTAFLFLSSMPVAVPAGLVLATGFWHALFELSFWSVLAIKLGTLAAVLLLGLGGARFSGNVQMLIALLVMALMVLLWWGGDIHFQDARLPVEDVSLVSSIVPALAVMFWCFVGIEAFTHMGEEFKKPERDFPIALLLGVVIAGMIYWGCAVAVIKFNAYGSQTENTGSIPALVAYLFGTVGKWLAAIIGYLACFASINIYIQGFARLMWSMADEGSLEIVRLKKLSSLSEKKVPVTALCLVVGVSLLSVTVTPLFRGITGKPDLFCQW